MRCRATRGWPGVALLVVASVAVVGATARANHQFSDVAATAAYHDAASWLATRAITLGCAAGLYCPNDPVTRGQMALFMNRLGAVMSPRFVATTGGSVVVDPDGAPTICQTADYAPAFPQRATADASVSVFPTGVPMSVTVQMVYSTNGGATWTALDATQGRGAATSLMPLNVFTVPDIGLLDLTVGQTYRFGARIARFSGDPAADALVDCHVVVTITNRNPDGQIPDATTGSAGGRR